MKIIGKTDNGSLLVEMKTGELSNMAFSHYSFDNVNVKQEGGGTQETGMDKLKSGDEFEISDNFEKAKLIYDSFGDLRSSISSIKSACTKFQNAINNES